MLFAESKLGAQKLKNHMVMSAMTRCRAGIDGIVGDMTVEYYAQRASAGLIMSEGINISSTSLGTHLTPGIFKKAQIEAWKKVTSAVHKRGTLIYAELWHAGRVGHSVDRNGMLPVAPSAIAIRGTQHHTSLGKMDFEIPHALTDEEIDQTIQDYRQAAINAMEAGFDGIEFHAANGYLPHQFLSDNANQRSDRYGGSIENKSRYILEVMQVLINTIGSERVGIKLSPLHPYAGIVFQNPVATFTYLINELNKLDFAFLEIMKRGQGFPLLEGYPENDEIELFGSLSKNILIANSAYTKQTGESELQKGLAKLISYGSSFLANPDLPARFEKDAALNKPDVKTFFLGGSKGYIDYPFMSSGN